MPVGIYRITSSAGFVYIGRSRNTDKRQLTYRYYGAPAQRKLHDSIKSYGWASHKFEVIQEVPPDISGIDFNEMEASFIELYKCAGYNMLNIFGKGNNWDGKFSADVIEKIKVKNKGKIVSKETREKLGRINKGKKPTEERRMKQSEALKGIKSPRERVERQRQSNTGKKRSDESRKKISIGKTGVKFSDEHRRNISLSHKGPRPWAKGVLKGPQKQITCPYCQKTGGATGMKRCHFENCKFKPNKEQSAQECDATDPQ